MITLEFAFTAFQVHRLFVLSLDGSGFVLIKVIKVGYCLGFDVRRQTAQAKRAFHRHDFPNRLTPSLKGSGRTTNSAQRA